MTERGGTFYALGSFSAPEAGPSSARTVLVDLRTRRNQYLGEPLDFGTNEGVELFWRGRSRGRALREHAFLDVRKIQNTHDLLVDEVYHRPRRLRGSKQSIPLIVFEARQSRFRNGGKVWKHRRALRGAHRERQGPSRLDLAAGDQHRREGELDPARDRVIQGLDGTLVWNVGGFNAGGGLE